VASLCCAAVQGERWRRSERPSPSGGQQGGRPKASSPSRQGHCVIERALSVEDPHRGLLQWRGLRRHTHARPRVLPGRSAHSERHQQVCPKAQRSNHRGFDPQFVQLVPASTPLSTNNAVIATHSRSQTKLHCALPSWSSHLRSNREFCLSSAPNWFSILRVSGRCVSIAQLPLVERLRCEPSPATGSYVRNGAVGVATWTQSCVTLR
jgi:hypothetical protein